MLPGRFSRNLGDAALQPRVLWPPRELFQSFGAPLCKMLGICSFSLSLLQSMRLWSRARLIPLRIRPQAQGSPMHRWSCWSYHKTLKIRSCDAPWPLFLPTLDSRLVTIELTSPHLPRYGVTMITNTYATDSYNCTKDHRGSGLRI